MFGNNGDFDNLSWNMFAASGQIGYYLLYKNLYRDAEQEREEIERLTR